MRKPDRDQQSGQSLVEMTLGSIILIFIMSGILDFGRAYFTYVAMEDAVGEAALYMSINPECAVDPNPAPGDDCDSPRNAEARARRAAGDTLIDWAECETLAQSAGEDGCITITHFPEDGSRDDGDIYFDEGESVVARIRYPFELYTPVISQIVGAQTIILRSEATQLITTGGDTDP